MIRIVCAAFSVIMLILLEGVGSPAKAQDLPLCGQWVVLRCGIDHVPALKVCGTNHHIIPDPLAAGNWYFNSPYTQIDAVWSGSVSGQYWRLTSLEKLDGNSYKDWCTDYSVEPGFITSFWGEVVDSCAACQPPTPTPAPTSTPTPLPTVVVPTVAPPAPTATPSLSLPATPALDSAQLPDKALDRTITISPHINLRNGPSTNFGIVGNMRSTETYFLNGKDATGRWWFACCYLGQEFWVANYIGGVNVNGSLSDLPIVGPGETNPIQNTRAKQILFSAPGDKVTYIKISGENQLGTERVFERFYSEPVYVAQTEDWWWQGSVQLVFRLENSGWSGCIIEAIDYGGNTPNAVVTYSVATGCNGGNANVRLVPRPESPNLLELGSGLFLCAVGTMTDCLYVSLDVISAAEIIRQETEEKKEQTERMIYDFEAQGQWRRGDQSWGVLTYSNEQVHSGAYSARIFYNFPVIDDSFVVFSRAISISKNPSELKIWVYGDASGNFLNAWIKDAAGKRWQFTFGRIYHSGWSQMTALLNSNAGWPNGPLDGQNGAPQYPIAFDALVLDGVDEAIPIESVIYLDDLSLDFAP